MLWVIWKLHLNLIIYNKLLNHEHQTLILGKILNWNDDIE